MAVLTLTFEHDNSEIGLITEVGLKRQGWTLAADARIKTESDPVGVGPVAYKGVLKNSENQPSKDGYPRDAVFLFFTGTECRRAELFNQDPGSINDTINDFLANRGGSTSAMVANAPAVA